VFLRVNQQIPNASEMRLRSFDYDCDVLR